MNLQVLYEAYIPSIANPAYVVEVRTKVLLHTVLKSLDNAKPHFVCFLVA